MGVCGSENHKHRETDIHPSTANSQPNHSLIKRSEIRKASVTLAFVPITSKSKKEELKKFYNLMNSVGKGTFGLVREAMDLRSDKHYAIKTLEKKHFPEDKLVFLQREIDITTKVNHENVIRCYDVFEDRNYIHFVFDLCEGGDLFEYIISHDDHKLTEMRAAQLFSQMMDALHYLHQSNIVHRDVKLENFLVMQEENILKIKLIDFGFAVELKDNEKTNEKLGSLNYMAPEIHEGKDYDYKVDVWACGIVLYNMLSGKQPFSGENEQILINKIIYDDINFNYECWKTISPDCKNLIKSLLSKDPEKRPTPFEAKNDRWVVQRIKNTEDPTVAYTFQPKNEVIGDIIQSLNTSTTLKNEIFSVLLKGLDTTEANSIQDFIKKNNPITDSLSNFMISYEIFLNSILKKSSNDQLKKKLSEILTSKNDLCKKQKIDYNEFFNSFNMLKELVVRERIWNIFRNNDTMNLGYLSLDFIKKLFISNKIELDDEKINQILRQKNNTDKEQIDYELFYELWEAAEAQKK